MEGEVIGSKARGTEGEDLAAVYLERQGYRIRNRNYRFGRGEIDIVAEDGETLVFVEVKARRSDSYGAPEEAVTVHKRRQIRKIAGGYLFEKRISDRECRFDVIAVEYVGGKPVLRHIQHAF
jgi:putative endonuclease